MYKKIKDAVLNSPDIIEARKSITNDPFEERKNKTRNQVFRPREVLSFIDVSTSEFINNTLTPINEMAAKIDILEALVANQVATSKDMLSLSKFKEDQSLISDFNNQNTIVNMAQKDFSEISNISSLEEIGKIASDLAKAYRIYE